MRFDWLSEIRIRARAVLQHRTMERDLNDEMQFHVAQEARKYEQEGLDAVEARRRAMVAFGGMERAKEESRDARGIGRLERVSQDLRYAWRGMLRRPGFSFAVIVTMGLGIGANSAMFAVVDRLMLRPPPMLRDAERVHRIVPITSENGRVVPASSYPYTRYLDLRRWTHSFDVMAAVYAANTPVGSRDDARDIPVGMVSAPYFSLFDAPPVLGRFFGASEDTEPLGSEVVVLSYGLWQERYGGRADVLGTTLQVGQIPCTIIGVAPRGFAGTLPERAPSAWIPITAHAGRARFLANPSAYYTTYNWNWLHVVARRKAGVSVAEATADLTSAMQRSYAAERTLSRRAPPATRVQPRAILSALQPGRGLIAGTESVVLLWISGVAAIVLLIACANVANLLLNHALRRRREIALRLALGVSRSRLLSQLLTESLLLSFLGGALGLVLAEGLASILRRLFMSEQPPVHVIADSRTLVFSLVLATITGLVTGLAPSLHAGRDDLATALKAGQRDGTYQRSRTRAALLVAQAALSVVLLVGAGLFVRSFEHAQGLRLGYDVDPLLLVSWEARATPITDSARVLLARQVETDVRTIPGVANTTRLITMPFYSTETQGLFVAGVDSIDALGEFTLQSASPDFFVTMGTRIVRGRAFAPTDRAGAPLVTIVSESMARVLWPGRDAVGQCLRVGGDTGPCSTVVGIAEDIRQSSLREERAYSYYLAIDQFQPQQASVMVRARGNADALAETVRRRVQSLLPGDAFATTVPFRRIVDPQLLAWRSGATMFVVFGSLALVLAAIGLYSLLAYNVTQRTQELGVRLALGAQEADVLRLVIGEGMRLTIGGVVIGGMAALAASTQVQPLLFNQSARDPVVYGGVVLLLLLVAAAASVIPAIRASRLDANIALRAD